MMMLAVKRSREFVGEVGLAPESEFFISSLQVFYYLDDALTTDGHTLACVPESVEGKRRLPITVDSSGRSVLDDNQREPPWPVFGKWHDSLGRDQALRTDGVNVFVPAGAAVLMNNTNYHAGAVRQTSQQRRTISAVYRPEQPLTSSHGIGDFPSVRFGALYQSDCGAERGCSVCVLTVPANFLLQVPLLAVLYSRHTAGSSCISGPSYW